MDARSQQGEPVYWKPGLQPLGHRACKGRPCGICLYFKVRIKTDVLEDVV